VKSEVKKIQKPKTKAKQTTILTNYEHEQHSQLRNNQENNVVFFYSQGTRCYLLKKQSMSIISSFLLVAHT